MASSLRIWPVLTGMSVAVALLAAPVAAHRHARHSADCIFAIEGVQVELRDLADGVEFTMTSQDEKVVASLQKRAWEQVEPEDGTRKHECFFHTTGAQALVKEVHDGVILTITSINDETIVRLQEMARQKMKKGCRHGGRHESRH